MIGAVSVSFNEVKECVMKRMIRVWMIFWASVGLATAAWAQQVLEEFFDDPKLIATIAIYWCYLGVPPSQLPFADLMHRRVLRLSSGRAFPVARRVVRACGRREGVEDRRVIG